MKENGQHSDEIIFYHTITGKDRNNRRRTVLVFFFQTTDLAVRHYDVKACLIQFEYHHHIWYHGMFHSPLYKRGDRAKLTFAKTFLDCYQGEGKNWPIER